MIKVRGFEAPAAKIPPRIAPGRPARPFFSAPKRLAGSRPGAPSALRYASAGRSEARHPLPTYPARGPGPTFATGGGSSGKRSQDVEDLGAVLESLFCIAPNKNLRARGQAGRCQPCGIPIEASCAARARGAEAYHQLGALILASSRDRCLRWLQHCAARPALPTHCHTCTSRQGFRAARRAGRAGEAYRHSDDGVDRLSHRHGAGRPGVKSRVPP